MTVPTKVVARATLAAVAGVCAIGIGACGGGGKESGSPPAAPTGVSATGEYQQAIVSWTASSGATSYNVYYSASATVSKATGTKVTGATSGGAVTGLTNGTPYYFVVTAVNQWGESAESSPGTATPTYTAAPPKGVSATPGNGAATVSWAASAGATSYNVYYDPSPAVSTASPKVTVSGSPAAVPSLGNGTAYYFAVTAVNPWGESALSAGACAVPTAASQVGLTFRDGLCGTSLDGAIWWPNGLSSVQVSGGAAELSTGMDDMEPYAANGAQYVTSANVNAAGARVTTLRGTLQVPSASAALDGSGSQVRASFRLIYSPPSKRLLFPKGLQDLVNFEVGLIDLGSGLMAFRQLNHCDDASCSTYSGTGISFGDPSGWVDAPGLASTQKIAPAAYDTTYTVEVRLAETEGSAGVFHWSISGGSFGAGVSGTADPAAYLGSASGWSGISLSGGFQAAQMAVRTSDRSTTGGGSGRMTGRFGAVWVGTNDQPAAAFDDFSGTGGNSAPPELSFAKWSNGGARSIAAPGGALAMSQQATSTGSSLSSGQAIVLANPASVNAIQADIRVASFSASASVTANTGVRGRFYNDGTAGGVPGSALGDIFAAVFLSAAQDNVSYLVARCPNATCSGGLTAIASGTFSGATVGSGVHAVLVKWDPTAKRFTLGFDGALAVVDPTGTAPVAGPANAPFRDVFTANGTPPTAGASGSIDVRVNNVFTAP